MSNYCLVKDGVVYEGTKEEIVQQVVPFTLVKGFNVTYIHFFYKKIRRDTISYSKEYTEKELQIQARDRIIRILVRDGWRLYIAV